MRDLYRYTPIADLPGGELVDEEYAVSQVGGSPLVILVLVFLGWFPRPVLVGGKRHWTASQLIEWSNRDED